MSTALLLIEGNEIPAYDVEDFTDFNNGEQVTMRGWYGERVVQRFKGLDFTTTSFSFKVLASHSEMIDKAIKANKPIGVVKDDGSIRDLPYQSASIPDGSVFSNQEEYCLIWNTPKDEYLHDPQA